QPAEYKAPKADAKKTVKQFLTYFPAESAIQPILDKLRSAKRTTGEGKEVDRQEVTIEVAPPAGASGLLWITLLLPTFLIVGLLYMMMRRGRDHFRGGILGNFVKSPARRHDKSKQRTTFDEVAGL